MSMRVFVINLPEMPERREHIAGQLEAQGVPFSFFEGIDLRSDRRRYFHHCDEAQFQLLTGRVPTVGELGCYASHLMLWRTCKLLDEPVLILEDDAMLADDFGKALLFLERITRRFGFIRLQPGKARGGKIVFRHRQRRVDFCARFPHGSLAYTISPAVADAFVRKSRVFRAPVDVFIKRFWEHGQPLYSVSPALADASELSNRSSLSGRTAAPGNVPLAVRRWLGKRADFVARARFNLGWARTERKRASMRLARRLRLAGFRSDG